jgi:hypothetical protein
MEAQLIHHFKLSIRHSFIQPTIIIKLRFSIS